MTSLMTDIALWSLSVCLVGALLVVLVYRRKASRAIARERELATVLRRRDDELRNLLAHRLPEAVSRLSSGRPAADGEPLPAEERNTPVARLAEAVPAALAEVAAQTQRRAEAAAHSAVKTLTRSMQALVSEQQATIMEMIRRHDDDRVLADASAIDHASAQLGRRAQVIAVLTGSWPGRQRLDSSLLDVVRGGVSKIRDYRRVQIIGEPPVCVVSRAVEPVVLAVAELLDNAARHSEPGSDVHVWFMQAHNGVSVIIDDSGIGMKPEDKAAAWKLLTAQEPVHLTRLRNPPKLGLAAVGVLGERYGFRASVEQESPYGGVRAVLYLPRELLTTPAPPEDARVPASAHPAPIEAAVEEGGQPGPTPSAVSGGETPDLRVDGLPQRRRRRPRTDAPALRPVAVEPPDTKALGAFARGRRTAQQPTASDERNTD
jgi:two-component sensor histidine kinase